MKLKPKPQRAAIILPPRIQPDKDGRCGRCGAAGFSYEGIDYPERGKVRGYHCMTCGAVKPEGWREKEVPEPTA